MTKLYQTKVEVDRGFILGSAYRNLQITGYFYNPFTEDAFFMLALAVDF